MASPNTKVSPFGCSHPRDSNLGAGDKGKRAKIDIKPDPRDRMIRLKGLYSIQRKRFGDVT
jgi:hypothetical protein